MMINEFLIEKLEANWKHIESALSPIEWLAFVARYRSIVESPALAPDEALTNALRELMNSTAATSQMWEEWRDELGEVRISGGGAVRSGRDGVAPQQPDQLINRYRQLGASQTAPSGPAPSDSQNSDSAAAS